MIRLPRTRAEIRSRARVATYAPAKLLRIREEHPLTAPSLPEVAARGYARPDVLVTTDWLAQHLDDPKIR